MTSTYVNNLRLNEMGTGDASGTWGTITNTNLTLIADAFGYQSKTVASASTDTLTIPDGTETNNEAISLYIKLSGGNQACTITIGPNTVKKLWIIENATSYTMTLTQGSGANVILASGVTKMIYADGAGSGAALTDALASLEVGANFYIKNAATGDNSTANLYLQTAEADIAANDVLGTINFQAPDEGTGTDAILVAAGIAAISEGDFSSTNNATKLSFKTAASDTAAETMALSSAGNLTCAGTFVPTGKITSDAGIDIDNINIDGTTMNLSSGDLTISAAGDLIFSTSGRDTTFSYAGTPEANIHTGTGSTVISTLVSDRNLDFAGNDGGSTVTVCSFDMSENGFATFRTAAVFNEESIDADFRVESDGQANMLLVDAGNNAVLINNSSRNGSEQFHVTGLCYIDTTQGTGYGAASNSGSIVIGASNYTAVNANAVVQQRIYGGGDHTGQRISIKYRTRDSDTLGSETAGAYCTGTAWTDSSDIAYKDNIVDIPYGLETIGKLQPRKWKWNTTHKDDIGFVAQEIEKEIPEVVTGEDGEKGLHYGSLVAVCVKAIQELEARIKVLEGK
jgi:hypothetical protein